MSFELHSTEWTSQFAYRTSLREDLRQQACDDKTSAILQDIVQTELDYLRRTIYITDVEGLKSKSNLNKLRSFLVKRFGRIEECMICHEQLIPLQPQYDSVRAQHPPARVRFAEAQDAQKVFGGRELLGLNRLEHLEFSLGTIVSRRDGKEGRYITIRPSYRYDGMLREKLEQKILSFPTEGLSLGHWVSPERDLYHLWKKIKPFNNPTHLSMRKPMEFLQEVHAEMKPLMRFDLYNRRIELEIQRHYNEDNVFDFQDVRDFLLIPFKSLMHYVELCREVCVGDDRPSYYLLFSLKYPPLIESEQPMFGHGYALEDMERERSLTFGRLHGEVLGQQLCYKVAISRDTVRYLMGHGSNLKDLKSFGVFDWSLWTPFQARTIKTVLVDPKMKNKLQVALEQLHRIRPRLGKSWSHKQSYCFDTLCTHRLCLLAILMRAFFDQPKANWYDALHDTVQNDDGITLTLMQFIVNSDERVMEDVSTA
jgi:hypothetical protein